MSTFSNKFGRQVQAFDDYLDDILNDSSIPQELLSAIRYSALAGGKRIRPLLVYASGSMFGAPTDRINVVAAAIEMIHCYSLIHDDLPCMDDDDLRRGKPTLHIAYDEALAVLAGDSLLTMAFELISTNAHLWNKQTLVVKAISTLALNAGPNGMVGGQVLDIRAEGTNPSREQVEKMFLMKTGALIRASVQLGLCCSDQFTAPDWHTITQFGNSIGQAFQIQDDILDVVASSESLGKPQGSDEENNKPNYALKFGLSPAQNRAKELYDKAIRSLSDYGESAVKLIDLASYIIYRKF